MAGDNGMMLPQWLAERRDGTYADGRRFDEICYLLCKLILAPDRFTSARVFRAFARKALDAWAVLPRAAADRRRLADAHTKTGAVYRLKGNPPQAHE